MWLVVLDAQKPLSIGRLQSHPMILAKRWRHAEGDFPPWIAGDINPLPHRRDTVIWMLYRRGAGVFYLPYLVNEDVKREKHFRSAVA